MKTKRKLSLSKETLKSLTPLTSSQTHQIVGGGGVTGWDCLFDATLALCWSIGHFGCDTVGCAGTDSCQGNCGPTVTLPPIGTGA
jgi:hypothetical protein